MKKRFINALTILTMCSSMAICISACDKDEVRSHSEATNNEEDTDLSTIDLSNYFQQSEQLLHEFWAACDKAFNTDAEAFLYACSNNDLNGFLEATGMTLAQLNHFQEVITQERAALEVDYPGICEKYKESSCHDCQQDALPRVGRIVMEYQGQVSTCTPKASAKMCIFICSMACMTTMELFLPCLAACASTCMKI